MSEGNPFETGKGARGGEDLFSVMGFIGALLIVAGVVGIWYFGFQFNVGVSGPDGSSVVNMGLANDRLIGVIVSVGVMLLGGLFVTARK